MVTLPTVSDRIVTSEAPQSSVSRSDIIGHTDMMAGALSKVADAQMEIATRQAKEQAADDLQKQKVTLNADGSVNVETPANSLIVGRAGDAYSSAVKAGTIAQHSNVISEHMNDLHRQNPTDPAAFKAAADAWKVKYAEQHGSGEVGLAIKQQSDQSSTQHYNAITNTAANIDVTNQQKSIQATITDQKNTLQGLARQSGGTDTPEFKTAVARMEASYQALATNPLFKMPQDQIDLEVKNFKNLLQGEALVSHIDETFTKKGKGDAQKALTEGVLANPNLSEADRNRLYSHGMARLQYLSADAKERIDAGRKVVSEFETNLASGVLKPTDPIIGMEIKQAIDRGDPESANRITAAVQARLSLTGLQTLPQRMQAEVLGIKPPGAVNTAIPIEGRALLDHIAGTESAGRYDVRYGGKSFVGFDDHPRIAEPITSGPDVGKVSTAAGRYQFIGSTWDQQKTKLGLKDFKPESQDTAAWDLAQTEYKTKTGNDLLTVLKSGNQAAISDVPRQLSGQWSSLPGGRQPAAGAPQFVPNLAAADRELRLSPQERNLYQGHLRNLTTAGGVDNADGSRSTVLATSVESDGKTYMIPTVYDGKIVSGDEAWQRAKGHLEDFPAYASQAEAKARYDKMHTFMEADTGSYQQSKMRPAAIAPSANNGPGFTAADLKRNPFLGSAYVRTLAADEGLRMQSARQAAEGANATLDKGLLPSIDTMALILQTGRQYPESFGPTAAKLEGRLQEMSAAQLEKPERDAVVAAVRERANGQDVHHQNVATSFLDQYTKSEKALAEHPYQEAATRGWIAPVAPIDPAQPATIPAALAQRVAASERIAAMNHSPAPPVLGKDEIPQLQAALDGPAGAAALTAIATTLKPDDLTTLLGQKGFTDSLTSMMSSKDPVKMSTAMSVVDKLWRDNAAEAEKTLGNPAITKLQAWQGLRGTFSAVELAEKLNMSDDPSTVKAREAAKEEADKEVKSLTPTDMAYKLGTSWGIPLVSRMANVVTGATPAAPFDSITGGAMVADYRATYTALRTYGVDADKASELAVQRLGSTWGVSAAAGNQVMRNPPERSYPAIGASHDWMKDDLNKWVAAKAGPEFRDGMRSIEAGVGFSGRERNWSLAGLIADGQTQAEIAAGRPPSYQVAIKKADGTLDIVRSRIAFDPSDHMMKYGAGLQEKQKNFDEHDETLRQIQGDPADPNFWLGAPI